MSKDKKTQTSNTTAPVINGGSYEQQMANTIAMQQQQLQALAGQMYPGRANNLTTENTNIINVGQSAPVVDGGIAGKDYYSASPTTFVAPNMESRNRMAAAAVNEYKTNENFINNFDSYMASFKNLRGMTDEVYTNLVNNAYSAISELADRDDLENVGRHIQTLSGNIANKWGGAKLNQAYNDYTTTMASIDEKAKSFDPSSNGGYSSEQAQFAKEYLVKNFTPPKIDENGRVIYDSTKMPELQEYLALSKEIDELSKGWLADGTFVQNADGTIRVGKPMAGYHGLKYNEVVDEATIRNMAIKKLRGDGHEPYINEQGQIRTYNLMKEMKMMKDGGLTDEQAMAQVLTNLEANYTSPNEMTNIAIRSIREMASKAGVSVEALLVKSPELVASLMRNTYQDDIISPAASKYSYVKEELKTFEDKEYAKELELKYKLLTEEAMKANGYGTYYDKPSSKGSGSDGDEVGADGPSSFSSYVVSDEIDTLANYNIPTFDKYHDEAQEKFNRAKMEFDKIKGDPKASGQDKQIKEKALADADKEFTYFKEVKKNLYRNLSGVLSTNKVEIDKTINSLVKDGTFKDAETARKFAVDVAHLSVSGKYNSIMSTSEYDALKKKYGLDTNVDPITAKDMYTRARGGALALANTIHRTIDKLDNATKDTILAPQTTVAYLHIEGATAKNIDATLFDNMNNSFTTLFKKSPTTFKMLGKDGKAVDFIQGISDMTGIKREDVFYMMDKNSISINASLTKDYILSKETGQGQQALLTFNVDTNSKVYKDNEKKIKKLMSNGTFKVLTSIGDIDSVRAEVQRVMDKVYEDFSSRGDFKNYKPETLRALGMGYVNSMPGGTDLDKFTFYDLEPGGMARAIEIGGDKFAISAVKSDYFGKGNENKDFRISRQTAEDAGTSRYSEHLVYDRIDNKTVWVTKREMELQGGKSAGGRYTYFTANTPEEVKGIFGVYLLQDKLNKKLQASQGSNKLAKGGTVVKSSGYPMPEKYTRLASTVRTIESSGDYYKSPTSSGLGYGGYQFVPYYHEKDIKKLYGLSMEEFRKNPVAQDKYFEKKVKDYEDFLNKNNRGMRLLNIIRKEYPTATYDYAIAAVHFWGDGNIDKLLSGAYTINKKIKFTYKGERKENPSLVQHLHKFHKNY